MHLETDPKTHGHFEQTRVGKTTVNSRLFVPNVLDYEQNPNQIMNDIYIAAFAAILAQKFDIINLKSRNGNSKNSKQKSFKSWPGFEPRPPA